jgi:hypothetical protein
MPNTGFLGFVGPSTSHAGILSGSGMFKPRMMQSLDVTAVARIRIRT